MPSTKRKTPSRSSERTDDARRSDGGAGPSGSRPPDEPRVVLSTAEARAGGDASAAGAEPVPPRARRHVQPLGPRVLVRIRDVPQRLDSGLYLPATAVSNLPEAVLAEVVEVARTAAKTEHVGDEDDPRDESEVTLGENVSGVPLGALVLFGRDHGIRVPWDDRLRLVEVRHILAIVDEIPEDALQ